MKRQRWQTEPEISDKRKEELRKYRNTPINTDKGIYQFGGVKLNRADVEWLLETHENGLGPVLWSEEQQRNRKGLDLRGADLRGDGSRPVDLSKLPLTRLTGGPVTFEERTEATEEQYNKALIQLDRAILKEAKLEEANFYKANLERANLKEARLEGADLSGARLQKADLSGAHLEGANLSGAHLATADLSGAHLEGANLSGARLEEAVLIGARLEKAVLSEARLKGAKLNGAVLEGANLSRAHLTTADLSGAVLEGAKLNGAVLEGANLNGAHLATADLSGAVLEGANLREAQLESAKLEGAILSKEKGIGPFLVDVQWGNTNLAVVDWTHVVLLGEAHVARQGKKEGIRKTKMTRFDEYRDATRANRQLAVALQGQGLYEEATHFAYDANNLQRKVYWYQMFVIQARKGEKEPTTQIKKLMRQLDTLSQKVRTLGSYIFSFFLNRLAGYGYKPGRTFLWYIIAVFVFAALYAFCGKIPFCPDAIVLSILSFHGRGFFPGISNTTLNTSMVKISAAEAIVGLLIELSFIATFTQRFFGK